VHEFLHAWDAHWTRYENSEWAHVRSGWVNVDANTVANGAAPRLVRLSLNGTTDVTQEWTWLDSVVGAFVDPSRFPTYGMPVVGPVSLSGPPVVAQPTGAVNATNGQNATSHQVLDNGRNGRIGVVEPRLSLTPLISQIERMQTE
jgi:hypothetical protein